MKLDICKSSACWKLHAGADDTSSSKQLRVQNTNVSHASDPPAADAGAPVEEDLTVRKLRQNQPPGEEPVVVCPRHHLKWSLLDGTNIMDRNDPRRLNRYLYKLLPSTKKNKYTDA